MGNRVYHLFGAEANELAIRLARAHTGAHDVVVVDGAYHGNTTLDIQLSPYKFKGRGGFAQVTRLVEDVRWIRKGICGRRGFSKPSLLIVLNLPVFLPLSSPAIACARGGHAGSVPRPSR